MRPAREGREHAHALVQRVPDAEASMRPAREGREHSRIRWPAAPRARSLQ